MSEIAIKVEGLSKKYRINDNTERYKTLRSRISSLASIPLFRKAEPENEFWALRDVSFEVKKGEVVGVIGFNGAGKSTLLKILSRITEPTSGYAQIKGRVGSLLEVGTGFHLELSGRENIYLNGAILGMKRREIDRKFDQIVEFAEVERFIDTPVKHYSSGMHLRLAFSVAAHLEPEILLVDEVLAVGDAVFQKRCLGKMGEVASEGRTVLFVSHNLAAIKELCQTSLVLSKGVIDFRGSVVEGLARYNQTVMGGDEQTQDLNGWQRVVILNDEGRVTNELCNDRPFSLEAVLSVRDRLNTSRLFCILNDSVGEQVVHQRVYSDTLIDALEPGQYKLRVRLPVLWLAPGIYTIYLKLIGQKVSGGDVRHISNRVVLDVSGNSDGIAQAALAPPYQWEYVVE